MCSNLTRKSPTKIQPIIEEDEDKIRKSIPSSKTSENYMNLKTVRHELNICFRYLASSAGNSLFTFVPRLPEIVREMPAEEAY